MNDQDQKNIQAFVDALPHAADLGMEVEDSGPGRIVLSMPWQADLVGDPATGVVHGGVVFALVDTASGTAVGAHPECGGPTATLNLRIDYMRPAKSGARITAEATCYHVTKTVAFVRAAAHDGDPSRPVATASAAFTFKRLEKS